MPRVVNAKLLNECFRNSVVVLLRLSLCLTFRPGGVVEIYSGRPQDGSQGKWY